MEFRDQVAAVAVGLVIVVVAFLRSTAKPRRPKATHFTCSRCQAPTRHNARTIRAWRLGKPKFFCGACHRVWLDENDMSER